jgi:hypothetical protein
MILFLAAADAFEIENFAEVVVISVRDVDKVGLDQSFWW